MQTIHTDANGRLRDHLRAELEPIRKKDIDESFDKVVPRKRRGAPLTSNYWKRPNTKTESRRGVLDLTDSNLPPATNVMPAVPNSPVKPTSAIIPKSDKISPVKPTSAALTDENLRKLASSIETEHPEPYVPDYDNLSTTEDDPSDVEKQGNEKIAEEKVIQDDLKTEVSEPEDKKEDMKVKEKDTICVDPTWGVCDVCDFLRDKGMNIDWVLKESVDGMAYQTLDITRLHEKWKVASYGTCIKILSYQQWPAKNGAFGSPLVPTPDMMRRQSLSYWGVGSDVPPSEKIVTKVNPPNSTELMDRIVANRTRRDENLRERSEKKKAKEANVKILQREKSGRGFKYLIEFNNTPKWVNRSQIPKRFSCLVEQFDKAWKDAIILANDSDKALKNLDEKDDFDYDDDNDDDDDNEEDEEDEILKDIGLSRTVYVTKKK